MLIYIETGGIDDIIMKAYFHHFWSSVHSNFGKHFLIVHSVAQSLYIWKVIILTNKIFAENINLNTPLLEEFNSKA